jgi:NadR type nicotinamide-nucleotide adenylyltransferase
VYRISITGPESTGKSALARQLGAHFNTVYVPEAARDYLYRLGRPYNYEDIVLIAKEQLRTEDRMAAKATEFLFCDTDPLVTKIWSLYKYGRCDPWIEEQVKNHRYDLYLLCDIDLPWEDDPLREHPGEREVLFSIYKAELEKLGANYRIISGTGEDRSRKAILAVEETFI